MSNQTPSKKRSSDDDFEEESCSQKTRKLNNEISAQATATDDADEAEEEEEQGPTVPVSCIQKSELDVIKQTGFMLSCDCKSTPDHLKPSEYHQVLFTTDESNVHTPCPIDNYIDRWDDDHVRLPCSDSNVNERNEKKWPPIQRALGMMINTLKKDPDPLYIEAAIKRINPKFKNTDFNGLKNLFYTHLDKEESADILKNVIPKMAELALALRGQIRCGLRLLRSPLNYSITMTQMQCACLLANAFFCTFPDPTADQLENYPFFSFEHLFCLERYEIKYGVKSKYEKLKCILHYFKRVLTRSPEEPIGLVTFSRQRVKLVNLPHFYKSNAPIPNVLVRLDGVIEDCQGALQADFANKFIGGGVLSGGCVQEEIRFVICPELLVSLLFTEVMKANECVLIKGAERYSSYTGYGKTFKWACDFKDDTPFDKLNRRDTEIVAIDAIHYRQSRYQFDFNKINRELAKCYTGFYTPSGPHACSAVATGNWGCGAFNGDRQLKFLIQLIAAAETKRDLIYYTFNDTRTTESLNKILEIIRLKSFDVSGVYNLILEYCKYLKAENKYNVSLLTFISEKNSS